MVAQRRVALSGATRGRNPRCGNGLARKTCVQRSGKAMSTRRQGGRHEGLKVQCKTGRLAEEHHAEGVGAVSKHDPQPRGTRPTGNGW